MGPAVQDMKQQQIRLLVVGGNGFIGKHIVNHAIRLGWNVTNLSLKSRDEVNHPNLRYLSADIADKALLKEKLREASFEYVVNCGGYIDHTPFFKGGGKVFDTHFGGVLNLVEAMNRDKLRSFVNIGSSDEYGDNEAPQIETQREAPISPYSMGKVGATHFLQMLYQTENFPATTLRLFLTYGPGQDNSRFLPQIIIGCLENRRFPASKGEQLRDFCFIQDTVESIFSVFESPAARGEVINIGSGKPVSIRKVIETVNLLTRKGKPQFGRISYRPGENMKLYGNISKSKILLGWESKVTLENGLFKTIQWFKDNS
jgi:nucleoside-diphosphate-sugar epimerase